ncbi:MAG: hypothetical protein L6R41_004821 [Letrouitia leprolyta]|nr:MAG: hypothetical protein L6R41_004821 [Letrouitia leprolyta]
MHPQPGTSFRSLLGIPPSTPSPADSTLLIIDAQNEYDHGALAIHEVKKSRAVIAEVLKKYRDAGGDVVHVVQQTPPGAPLFTPGTELAEEFEELRPGDSGEEKALINPPSAGTRMYFLNGAHRSRARLRNLCRQRRDWRSRYPRSEGAAIG